MKLFKLSIVFLSSVTMLACSQSTREIIREVPARPAATNSEGPVVTGGGGNGVEDLVFESYNSNLLKSEEFNEFLAPLLERLKLEAPFLASDLQHIIEQRVWYVAPVNLKKKLSDSLGIDYVSDTSVQQLAIQDLKEVWIDAIPYQNKMTAKQRAVLVLHEMVMGVRLLDFSGRSDLCIADLRREFTVIKNPNKEQQTKFLKDRNQCLMTYPSFGGLNPTKPLRIHPEDYKAIRQIVVAITNESNGEYIEALMSSAGFGRFQK